MGGVAAQRAGLGSAAAAFRDLRRIVAGAGAAAAFRDGHGRRRAVGRGRRRDGRGPRAARLSVALLLVPAERQCVASEGYVLIMLREVAADGLLAVPGVLELAGISVQRDVVAG